MMAKIKDIKHFYRLRPSIDIWFTNAGHKTKVIKLLDETWHGGDWFVFGILLLFRFYKKRTIHVKIEWWNLEF